MKRNLHPVRQCGGVCVAVAGSAGRSDDVREKINIEKPWFYESMIPGIAHKLSLRHGNVVDKCREFVIQ